MAGIRMTPVEVAEAACHAVFLHPASGAGSHELGVANKNFRSKTLLLEEVARGSGPCRSTHLRGLKRPVVWWHSQVSPGSIQVTAPRETVLR